MQYPYPQSADKNASKIPSAELVCCLCCLTFVFTYLTIEANRVDSDQAAPSGAVLSETKLFVKEAA